jgi:hypothetical protein
MKKNEISKKLLEVIEFGKLVAKKWIFWLFLILDIVTLIIQFIYPQLQIPQFIYIVLALIGFFVACFSVYSELLGNYLKIAENKNIVFTPKPHLELSLIEGNEFSFEIVPPYQTLAGDLHIHRLKEDKNKSNWHFDEQGIFYVDDEIYYLIPDSHLSLNARIENDGNIPLDILLIDYRAGEHLRVEPFMFYPDKIIMGDKPIKYPICIEPSAILFLQISFRITIPSELSEAQFAAGFRKFSQQFNTFISLDTMDGSGARDYYNLEKKLVTRPLIDLYIAQWQNYHQHDLLRLAGNE